MKCLLCVILIMIAWTAGGQDATIIIINARITTLDPSMPDADAIALAGHSILDVGTSKSILRLRRKSTVVIDAGGKRVVPGLFDSHNHIIRGGRFYNLELRWDGLPSLEEALKRLHDQARRTPPGQWVRVVGGWNEYQFSEKRLPTLEEINQATEDVPAFVLYLYGRAWVNQAGLRALNITAESPNPVGGLIERDIGGQPTGMLLAEPSAFILYSTLAQLPELNTAEKISSTIAYMTELNRLGVTAVMDAGGGFQNYPDDYMITDSLNRAGQLTLRLPYFLFAQKRGTESADFSRWMRMVDIDHQSGDYIIRGGGENLVAEAADFENFLFPRPDLPVGMEQKLKAVIELLVRNRWPFRLHATYDESISRDLDVIEAVNKTTPLNGLIWFIDHAETISEENMLRIKSLGGGIAIQHRMAYQGEMFIRRYGKQAALTAPPVRKMMKLGIPVGLGTDGTRVASYNPWVALYWITTGKSIGGNQIMSRENTLSRLEGLKLLTAGGYELIHEQDHKGILKRGYEADMVLLSEDYLNIPEERILKVTSLLTIVNGKIVWGDQQFNQYAPRPKQIIPDWSPVNYYGGYDDL